MTDLRRPMVAVLTGALAAVVVTLGWVWPSSAYAADPPQLSMTVDDGQQTAEAKADSDYTVTVSNLGAKKIKDLVVTLRVPEGAEISSVDQDGTVKKGLATWSLDVGAGKTVELVGSVELPATLPADLLRFAVVACSATSAKDTPLVCASDSNLLPAGARVEQEQRDLAPAAAAAARPSWLLPVCAGAVLVLVGGAAAGLIVRDRRRRRARLARQHARRHPVAGGSTDEATDSAPELTHLRG